MANAPFATPTSGRKLLSVSVTSATLEPMGVGALFAAALGSATHIIVPNVHASRKTGMAVPKLSIWGQVGRISFTSGRIWVSKKVDGSCDNLLLDKGFIPLQLRETLKQNTSERQSTCDSHAAQISIILQSERVAPMLLIFHYYRVLTDQARA